MKIDPVGYCRRKGVKIGNNVVILSKFCFGSEPYLVEIGDDVRINWGANFITHDGSMWVIRNLARDGKYPGELVNGDLFGKINAEAEIFLFLHGRNRTYVLVSG